MTDTAPLAVESSLNYSNSNIINAIRNTNMSMQAELPAADGTLESVVKIGDLILGSPAFIQHFSGLLTQIAQVRVTSRVIDEFYTDLIKGDVDHGGMIEEVFVNLTRARDFAPAKANQREFERIRPDIRAAFHKINWQAQYTATVDRVDIRKAFRSETGVVDLIERIVSTLRSSANLDHKLLTEYRIKRAILAGETLNLAVGDATDLKALTVAEREAAILFSNPSKRYNSQGVYTHTPRGDQWLVIDANTYARMDVEVLANAFNMDRTHLEGHLIVIDAWEEFDFDRFDVVNDAHKQLEPFTPEETAKLAAVQAVLIDREAFQFYNVTYQMSDKFSASGLHTNYFLTVERIYALSPFSNAVAFVTDAFEPGAPDSITATVDSISTNAQSTVVTLRYEIEPGKAGDVELVQTQAATDGHVYVKSNAVVFSTLDDSAETYAVEATAGGVTFSGDAVTPDSAVGSTIELTTGEDPDPGK